MGRLNTTAELHSQFRQRLADLVQDLKDEQLPLAVFETIRSPARQAELYGRGRDPQAADFGRTVTRAQAYESAHQWGLAADVVGFVDGKWTWDLDAKIWKRFGELCGVHNLERLSFEMPHCQLASWKRLAKTKGPQDDAGWLKWLQTRATGKGA